MASLSAIFGFAGGKIGFAGVGRRFILFEIGGFVALFRGIEGVIARKIVAHSDIVHQEVGLK